MTYSGQPFASPQEALAHHGVKGMHWGVRKDDRTSGRSSGGTPPTLTKKKQAKVETLRSRAAESKALADEMNKLGIESPEMRRLYGKGVENSDRMFRIMYGVSKENAVKNQVRYRENAAKSLEKDASAIEAGKMTRGQKTLLVGGLATAAVLGTVGYMSYQDAKYSQAGVGDKINSRVFHKRYSQSAEKYLGKKITSLSDLDDHDVHVPKGTVFSRLTAFKDEGLDKRLYTTFTDADNDKYRGLYGPALRMRTGNRQLYISHMTMGHDIRSPSHRKRVQAFVDMYMDEVGAKTEATRKYYEPIALSRYNAFARNLVADEGRAQSYFDRLKKMGYNAIVDDNDAGQLADLPMIIFDPKSVVSSRRFEPLTTKIERQSRKNLTEIHRYENGLQVPEQYRAKNERR